MLLEKVRTGKKDTLARKKAEEALDRAWSKAVRQGARWRCQRCLKYFPSASRSLEAHHIVKRRIMATRWDLENGIALCRYNCHPWAELNPTAALEWVSNHMGSERYFALIDRSREIRKWTPEEMAELLDELRAY